MKRTLLLIILLITGSTYSQNVTIPNGQFKNILIAANSANQIAKNLAGNYFKIDANNDGEIQNSEALQISYLNISNYNINAPSLIGIEAISNLEYLKCSNIQIDNLDLTSLTKLKSLYCSSLALNTLNIQGLNLLEYVDCSLSNLTTLNLEGLTSLKTLICKDNNLSALTVQGLANLVELNCSMNPIQSLNLQGLINLKMLNAKDCQLTALNVEEAVLLEKLVCSENDIMSLQLQNLSNLKKLTCDNNKLTTLNLQNNPDLDLLDCNNNLITDLSLVNLPNLIHINCSYNLITTLDVNHLHNLFSLHCDNNQLISLLAKNGVNEEMNFFNNYNLTFICIDDFQIENVQDQLDYFGITNCTIGSYCTFTPGGEFYTIEVNQKFATDLVNCETTNNFIPNFKYLVTTEPNTSTETSGIFISNNSGQYNINLQAGNHVLTPILQNPTYFSAFPETLSITFPEVASPYNQGFCITPNGIHNDLEVSLLPISQASPGFDSDYRIVFQNKGTTNQSGSVNLSYDDNRVDFISSNTSLSNQDSGNLSWNFTNIAPFETREIQIVFNLNSPLETPPLNSGDILSYTATIVGQEDESPADNVATINQIVVNSFDPNDKTCLEGTIINPSMAGKYVHYMIRFENLGTANAQNVVVKDIIDTSKFEINTLIPIKGSHSFETRISDTNKVEFIFENINLPFDDANNDGYVAFKIKTKSDLVVGDTFSNLANIYFDYNAPIITNNYITTLQNSLGLEDNNSLQAIVAFPNPVKDILNFTSEQPIIKVQIYDVSGRILSSNTISDNKLDVGNLNAGNYIIKLFTESGSKIMKIIKK